MRVRITFSKDGPLRYIGHLDLHTLWERAARRARLPLAYSHGFHPQPKIQLAAALPLGFASRCEVVDLRLDGEVDLDSLPERLQQAMPSGIGILEVRRVEENAAPLQTQVVAAEYEVQLSGPVEESGLADRVAALLQAASLPRERRGKPYDLRPLIEALEVLPAAGGKEERRLFMRLAARPGATGRPEEVLDALGLPRGEARIERTRLIFREESVQ